MTKADLVDVVAKKANLTAKAAREAVAAVFGAVTDALKKGDKVQVIDYGGVISIIPHPRDPIEESYGFLKEGPSLTEALLKSRREDAARDK